MLISNITTRQRLTYLKAEIKHLIEHLLTCSVPSRYTNPNYLLTRKLQYLLQYVVDLQQKHNKNTTLGLVVCDVNICAATTLLVLKPK